MKCTKILSSLIVLFTTAYASLPTPDIDNGNLELPPGFRALIVADKLIDGRNAGMGADQLRFITVLPNGDLYAKTRRGIIRLRDTTGNGRFDQRLEFGDIGGTGIAVYKSWIYFSSNSAIYRYSLDKTTPMTPPELIVTLLDEHHHGAKAFVFGSDNRLYVSIGAPFNGFGNPDSVYMSPGTPQKTSDEVTKVLERSGGIWAFDPEKLNQSQEDGQHYSTGHRHVIGLAVNPINNALYATQMGRDQLNVVAPEYYDELDNAERVAEEMHKITEGTNLGWPYTYWDFYKKARMISPEFGGDNRKQSLSNKYSNPAVTFPAHWAPLQLAFYRGAQFPEKYRGAFQAFHGSWNRHPLPQAGFNIAFVPLTSTGDISGTFEVFAKGHNANYRMGGVALGPDGSLFISETDIGRIWRIIYTGDTVVDLNIEKSDTLGRKAYETYCANCHMLDGRGVAQMQPALLNSKVVRGNPEQLIRVITYGPTAVLPETRPKYDNSMPAFSMLTDTQIAEICCYIRQTFGSGAAPVQEHQVRAQRP